MGSMSNRMVVWLQINTSPYDYDYELYLAFSWTEFSFQDLLRNI